MDCQKKGRLGEELAVKYLIGKGYEIIDRNARVGRLEIDIIGRLNGLVYFFEVKSDFINDGDSPLLRIDAVKLNHLHKAALGYLAARGLVHEYQLKAIAVHVDQVHLRAKIEVVDCDWN